MFFIIRVPYYVMAELAWNGQTLGKRLMKIKVVSHDGKSLSTHALVLRNLMKEAEIFLPATLLLTLDGGGPGGLGSGAGLDYCRADGATFQPLSPAAGRSDGGHPCDPPACAHPFEKIWPNPSAAKVSEKDGFVFLSHQLDHYGSFELQTLETLLRAQDERRAPGTARNQGNTIEAVVEKIRQKIGYANKVTASERLDFLRAFYNAQREHLEQRQLFGERRKDKHYAGNDPQS